MTSNLQERESQAEQFGVYEGQVVSTQHSLFNTVCLYSGPTLNMVVSDGPFK